MNCARYTVAGLRTSGMPGRAAKRLAATIALVLCANLAGCGPAIEKSQTSASTYTGAAFSGSVRGGQQPIASSLIQLYAVGTTGDKSAATALIATTATTCDGTGASNANANAGNANNSLPAGSFTITGAYTCPSPSAQVYLVATGGNPGLPAGKSNPQIALMAVLGQCGSLTPSTYININELTTVASIAPVFNFMASYSTLGSGASNVAALIAGLNQVPEYANIATGMVPGPSLPSGYYASTYQLRTLADILANCINSAGGVAGDSSVCGQIFQLATPRGGIAPTDSIQAAIDILTNPASNLASLFGFMVPVTPFQPAMPSAPASWALPITLLPTTYSAALNNTSFFIGASIVDYWPMPMNKDGVPGDTSSQVLARFSADVLNHGYSRVIILCGTNDVLDSIPNLTTELPANLQSMAAMATSAGIEVVLSELPPLSGTSASFNPSIVSANSAIAQLAAQHGYLVVDYYTPLVSHPEDFPDGIHPNAAGYAIMEAQLSAVVLY